MSVCERKGKSSNGIVLHTQDITCKINKKILGWNINIHALQLCITVNREYFFVKVFSDSLACAKLNARKYMHSINDNAVQGRLSENYFIYRMKCIDTKY